MPFITSYITDKSPSKIQKKHPKWGSTCCGLMCIAGQVLKVSASVLSPPLPSLTHTLSSLSFSLHPPPLSLTHTLSSLSFSPSTPLPHLHPPLPLLISQHHSP